MEERNVGVSTPERRCPSFGGSLPPGKNGTNFTFQRLNGGAPHSEAAVHGVEDRCLYVSTPERRCPSFGEEAKAHQLVRKDTFQRLNGGAPHSETLKNRRHCENSSFNA